MKGEISAGSLNRSTFNETQQVPRKNHAPPIWKTFIDPLSAAESDAKFPLTMNWLRWIAWWTESALVLLIMLIHRRVVKQIVQLELVLVHLRRTTSGTAPEAVEGREVVAAALVVALT